MAAAMAVLVSIMVEVAAGIVNDLLVDWLDGFFAVV